MAIHKHIKNYLIPHEGNDFEPKLFSPKTAVSIVVFVLAVFAVTTLGRIYVNENNMRAEVISSLVFDLTNTKRTDENLPKLSYSKTLEEAAQMKANDMAEKSYFAHTSPEGITPWHWFLEAGYTFLFAGENLAVDFDDSVKVNDAWMASPTHRANILHTRFREIGIATAPGFYKGRPTTFVVELFGTPATYKTPVLDVKPPVVKKIETPKPVANTIASNQDVKGESVSNEEEFIAVEIVDENLTEVLVTEENLEKDSLNPVAKKLILHPESPMRFVYTILGIIILLALLFRITIEYKRHHIRHLIIGVVLLALIVLLYFVYDTIFPSLSVVVL